jgi:hypothetical protein
MSDVIRQPLGPEVFLLRQRACAVCGVAFALYHGDANGVRQCVRARAE